MKDKIPRLFCSPVHSSGGTHRSPHRPSSPHSRIPVPLRRPKRRKPRLRILARSASEPILSIVQMFVPGNEEVLGINENPMFPRLHTCTDVFSPSLCSRSTLAGPRDTIKAAKVVVSVAVERSPGPVRAMVQLGASVEELIEVIVKKYCREGRSPRLNCDDTASFELHYSHFSLQSLKKSDKIGEIGGRCFYLCTNAGSRSFTSEGSEIAPAAALSGNKLLPSPIFFSIVSKKFARRAKKLWKVVTCIICI